MLTGWDHDKLLGVTSGELNAVFATSSLKTPTFSAKLLLMLQVGSMINSWSGQHLFQRLSNSLESQRPCSFHVPIQIASNFLSREEEEA